MADNDILRELLVTIGYQVDDGAHAKVAAATAKAEATLTKTAQAGTAARDKIDKDETERQEKRAVESSKKSRERLDNWGRDLQLMAVKVAAIAAKITIGVESLGAAGIVYAVDKAAKGFERLFYASQRIGSSAQQITAFTYASAQLGSTVDEANSSLEAFGEKLRLYPGYAQGLEALGVKTRNAKGELLDASVVATNLGKVLRDMAKADPTYGYTNAVARAKLYGFSEIQARAMLDPRFEQTEAERQSQQAQIGADPNAAAAGGTAFERSMRRLGSVIEDIGTVIQTALFKDLQPQLDGLSKWATENGGKIAQFVATVADGITKIAVAFVKSDLVQSAIGGMSSSLDRFAKYIGSDDFKRDIKGFVDDISALARAIRSALVALGIIPSKGGLPTSDDTGRPNQAEINQGNETALGAAARRQGTGAFGLKVQRRTNEERQRLAQPKLNRFRQGDGGGDQSHVAPDGPRASIGNNPNINKENANAIVSAAKELGTTPEDLATVMGYETVGKYSPSIMGGKGGNYMGLIQFGQNERQQYGASADQTFPEQMHAVVRYLKDRGYKPGMGLADLYSTINAGSPGHYNASDGNGTVLTHVARMQKERAAAARAFVSLADQPQSFHPDASRSEAEPPSPPHPDARRERTDPYVRKLPTMGFGYSVTPSDETPLHAMVKKFYDRGGGAMSPGAMKMAPDNFNLRSPLGITPSVQHSIDNSRTSGDTHITHNPTYNVSGGDVRQNMEVARLSASRGHQDLLRNMQGAEA